MKRPKQFWIIHLGSSETQLSGKRIFCQWLLKPCCKSYWDHLSSHRSNCKKLTLGLHFENSPAEVSLPPNTCDAKPAMKLCVTRECDWRDSADKCWPTPQHVNRKYSSTGKLWDGCLSGWTDSIYNLQCLCSKSVTEGLCVCCLQRLRQLSWRCCGSQMAQSHRMRGWVSNVGNWRWDMIE